MSATTKVEVFGNGKLSLEEQAKLLPSPPKLVVAISSRALFDLDESNGVYERDGVKEYAKYQIEHENDILQPGVSFPLVEKLLNLNKFGAFVEIILLSRNSADSGLRIFNSIQHYHLDITRAVFTSGESPHTYAAAFHSHLFLSANPCDVKAAIEAGCAAATIIPFKVAVRERKAEEGSDSLLDDQLRVAFDGDAVLFSDEAEKIYQAHGIGAFNASESAAATIPLNVGPLHGFLAALHRLQKQIPAELGLIRTALVTARAAPTHERVVRTLRAWDIRIDEALFLGGLDKGEFLRVFKADIFFDDQKGHCASASKHVATGHVPYGVVNRKAIANVMS